jgi:integrase
MKMPKYISTEVHNGKEYFYFRRPDKPKVRIKGVPWTPSFMAQYETACDGVEIRQPVAAQKKVGTFNWLCEQYFASNEYKALDDELSKPKRHRTLLKICREPIAPGSIKLFGDVPLIAWNRKAIRSLRDRYTETPHAANDIMKALRTVFKYGVDSEDCDNNPARDVQYLTGSTAGFHSWTIDEVETFEATHAVGTQERLAMGLLLFTGQRISDAIRVGPSNVKIADGRKWFVFTQRKNRNRKPIHMEIPIRPELEALIAATKIGGETFLTNSVGKPFTDHRASEWFSAACVAAGVPGRSHGLRKAAAARLAEVGATDREIMAITGHTTPKEISRYTQAADKRKLATSATDRHLPAGTKFTVGTGEPSEIIV